MTHDPRLETAAIDWIVRQREPDFEDWEGFADWLAADPLHQAVYQELAALDTDLGDLPAAPEPDDASAPRPAAVMAPRPRPVGRRAWLAGALAATVIGAVSIGLLQRAPDSHRIDTAMGETRLVTLDDGSRIALNGGTSLVLSRSDPRKVTLERGQVLFSVVHSDVAPFRVATGGAELVDIGTVFDVTRADGRTVVAVSEGAVVYNPRADNVRIDAGRRLAVGDGAQRPTLSAVNPAAVGGWQGGQLVYDGVPLGEVAQEIERTTGIRVRAAPAAGTILFRGALQTGDAAEDRLISDLAALSGTHATKDSEGWTLSR